jgi:N-acetylglucosamine malate deacetylase 1
MEFKRVLVLSPHTDDGELGAGGTIARLIEEGTEVYFLVFSSCGKSVPEGFAPDAIKKECQRATRILGVLPERLFLLEYEVRTFPQFRQDILENMIDFRKKIDPDLVLVPSSRDTHQDHSVVYSEAIRAFKKESSIWGYEHSWNNLSFSTDIFIRLSEGQLTKKLKALKCYKSQQIKSYFDPKYVRAIVQSRGTQVDWPYAESFELIRMLF